MDILKITKACVWISVLTQTCLVNESRCGKCPHSGSTQGPPLPTLPDSFQVTVEANILDKGYTEETRIYFDFSGNRAATKVFEKGAQSLSIFSFQTNELITLENSDSYSPQCLVERLDTHRLTRLFGTQMDDGNLHIGSSKRFLSFGIQNVNTYYIGNDTLRGLQVNHWLSCGTWNGSAISVDYYFTSNWSTASTAPNTPVMVEMITDKKLPSGQIRHLHNIYNYFSYIPDLDIDPTIFQTPPGVVCPNRKNTKMVAPIMDRFHYRTEIVYPDISVVTFEDVWYDESYRLFRHDYRQLSLSDPTSSVTPITEVHDFTRGVQYIIDKILGNCTTVPISNSSMDAMQNVTAYKINGSYVLNMKNPLQLFYLDLNYTYIGQQQVRGIFCDVFVAKKQGLLTGDILPDKGTIITVYFLNDQWYDIAEQKEQHMTVPIKMDVQSVESGYSISYNFVDFDAEPQKLNVFDVSQCYHEANKLMFKMTFPGTIAPNLTPTLLDFSQLTLAKVMGVSVLRVVDLHLDYDDAFVYITSTLLDRTLASAQFTVVRGTSTSRQDDRIINKVVDYEQCATYCITNDDKFICNGFDYCTDMSCHLSRYHIDHGATSNSSAFCDHFSRNVQGAPQERSITDAFTSLQSAVYTGKYVIDQFTERPLIATDIEILFGWANVAVSLPTISDHFSYRMEATIPAVKQIIASTTWYDKSFNLLRYDQHVNQAVYPFYTTDPLSVVEDYNNGIKYVINRMQGNCTTSRIAKGDFGSSLTKNGTWQLVMQNPLQIFKIDNTYRFVGQQTIRGMTCNVFESLRTDFKLPTLNSNITSLFRYSFLADGWSETDSAFLRSTDQPVRLEITVEQFSFYTQYNFFEFTDDTIDLSTFDIHQCFDTNQTQPFQIVFNGKYHPNLDTASKMFVIESLFKLANISAVSALRFQSSSLAYDNDYIYLTSSLVEHQSQLIYFTYLPNGGLVQHADRVLEGSDPEDCASSCLRADGFDCNSFYVCKVSNQCLLSAYHVPDGPGDKPQPGCSAYSRTVQDQGQELNNLMAYLRIKNSVYNGNLTIDIPVFGTEKTQTYVASSVRNPVRNPNEVNIKERAFKQFTKVADNEILADPTTMLYTISVDDCAQACLQRNEFVCDGFGYFPHEPFGPYCGLTRSHPELLNASYIKMNTTGSLFSRNYLTDFVKTPGAVPAASYVDSSIPNVQTDEQCARLCFTQDQWACRSLQYCQKKKTCLLFTDRVVGPPANGSELCNYYTSTYLNDFTDIDAGNFDFRASVVHTQDGSIEDCSKFCIDQQGSGCKGFYWCPHMVSCFLTSLPPDSADVNRSLSVMNFCKRFSRTHYPPAISTSSKATVATTLKPTTATKSSTSKATTTTTTVMTKCPTTTSGRTTRSSTKRVTTTAYAVPTPALQQKGNDPSKSPGTGLTIGLSVGMFLLGFILGTLVLHFYRRYKGLDPDGLKTNFAMHEDM